MKDIKRYPSDDTIFIKIYDCYIDFFFLLATYEIFVEKLIDFLHLRTRVYTT